MDFTEISFWWGLIIVGLPFFSVRYFCVKAKLYPYSLDKFALLFISLFLFFNAAPSSFSIFLITISINYTVVKIIISSQSERRSLWGALVILLDVIVLCYFKYFDFLLQNALLPITQLIPPKMQQYLVRPKAQNIPLGISFYTFQMIAFVADSLKNKESERLGFADYFNFISFFPKLVAGARMWEYAPSLAIATTVADTFSAVGLARWGASACNTFATPAICDAACAACCASLPATRTWMSPPIFCAAVTVLCIAACSDV